MICDIMGGTNAMCHTFLESFRRADAKSYLSRNAASYRSSGKNSVFERPKMVPRAPFLTSHLEALKLSPLKRLEELR